MGSSVDQPCRVRIMHARSWTRPPCRTTSISTSSTGPRRTCSLSASAPASTSGPRPIARYCLSYTNCIPASTSGRTVTMLDSMTPPNPPTNIQVTKLCDLGPRDSVCAVHWSREGSYLSIGTGLGDVQVCLAPSIFMLLLQYESVLKPNLVPNGK